MKFDVLIIGAGIFGLSTAFHLSSHPRLKVGVLEQFQMGHSFGSSHGSSRITRSIYTNPKYFELIKRCRAHEWPIFEKAAGSPLIYPNPACFMGQRNIFDGFLQTAKSAGLDIERLEVPIARKMFPQFRFSHDSSVLLDRTGGVIAAQKTMENLAKIALQNGVRLFEETQALDIDTTQDPIRITTNRGVFFTDRLVVTAGPWVVKLIPALERLLTPIRQTVCYFKLHGEKESYQVGRFPVWAHISDSGVFYGLPEFGCNGIKIAQHITKGKSDDPNVKQNEGEPAKVKVLEEFVKEHFTESIDQVVRSESCFYTNTENEDFILDFLDEEKRIVIGSACSGHGFKFAPLIGRILSELALKGATDIQEFEGARDLFTCSIPRLPSDS